MGVLHGDISPNTILILDWPPASPGGARREEEEKEEGEGKTEGALVDLDVPYTDTAFRRAGERWPPRRVPHSKYWLRREHGGCRPGRYHGPW